MHFNDYIFYIIGLIIFIYSIYKKSKKPAQKAAYSKIPNDEAQIRVHTEFERILNSDDELIPRVKEHKKTEKKEPVRPEFQAVVDHSAPVIPEQSIPVMPKKKSDEEKPYIDIKQAIIYSEIIKTKF